MKNLLLFFICFTLLIVTGCDSCLIPDDDDPTNQTQTHETGDTIWMHDMPGSDSLYFGNSIALGTDGSIYYSAANSGVKWINARIFAVNKEDGTLKWKSEPLDHIGLSSNIVVGDDGTIYVIGYYNLYAINPATGIFDWIWECPHSLIWDGVEINTWGQMGTLSLTNNGDLVLATVGSGVYHRSLFCVNKITGNLKWYNLDAVGSNVGGPGITIGKDGLLFYYSRLWKDNPDNKEHIIAVEPSTGVIKWKKKINVYGHATSNIVIDDNGFLICVISEFGAAGNDLYIRRIDPETGETLKSSPFTLESRTNFIGPDGYIYQHSSDADGQGYMRINPQLDGKVFFGPQISAINDHNNILCSFNAHPPFDPSLGIFNTDGSVDWSVPMGIIRHDILVSDSKVMYGVTNGQIFAIQGEAKLASSGWPRPAHDNRNTNNWNKK